MKQFQKTWLWMLAPALALAGCGRDSPPASKYPLPEPPALARGEPGRYGGQLLLSLVGDPLTLNPLAAADQSSLDLAHLLFAGLVSMDWSTQELRPALAESWQVEPDGRTWIFKLRCGLRWSDGKPLTADDVVFTWNEVIYNPGIKNVTAELFQIGGRNFAVSKLDDLTVRVVTPKVFAPFLDFFGSIVVLPKHALSQAVQEGRFLAAYSLRTPPDEIVGSGPFRFKQYTPGRSVVLERNPAYWMADSMGRRLPYFEHVICTIAREPEEALQRLLSGESHLHERVRWEQVKSLRQAAARGRVALVELGPSLEKDFLWFNQNTGTNAATGKPFVNPLKLQWFRDTRFRQAVSCALDRDRIVREVYEGRAAPNHTYLTVENKRWFNPNVPRFAHDPAKARALLGEMGFADRDADGLLEDAEGNPLQIVLNTNTGNPARQKTAQLIQDDLQRLGFRVRYEPLDFPVLVNRVNLTQDYECVLLGLGGGGLDPATSMNVLKSNDPMHQWFPAQPVPSTDWEARIDQLMDAQMRTLDYAERKRYFDEVQSILAEQSPMIFTVSPFAHVAVSPQIANLRPAATSPYRATWNIQELYFK